MTDFLNSKGLSREETVAKVVELTDGGADYTFDATGNTEGDAHCIGSLPSRLGHQQSSSAWPKRAAKSRRARSSL